MLFLFGKFDKYIQVQEINTSFYLLHLVIN